jgi:nicotinamide-nucleotide amidase
MATTESLVGDLGSRGITLATAESLTGGALGALITAIPGASQTYVGGVITYATEIKVQVLGVSHETVDTDGVVSEKCAREMAAGVRELLGTDIGVSTTGVAGPMPQEDKPVGLAYVGVAHGDDVRVREVNAEGSRWDIRRAVVSAAMDLLGETVEGIAERQVGLRE